MSADKMATKIIRAFDRWSNLQLTFSILDSKLIKATNKYSGLDDLQIREQEGKKTELQNYVFKDIYFY